MSEENKESVRDRMLKRYRVGKLSLGRFSEIQAAENDGREIDVTDEERAEYERYKPRMSKLARDLSEPFANSVKVGVDWKSMFDQADAITRNAPGKSPALFAPEVTGALKSQAEELSSDYTQMMDRINRSKREEYEREVRNSENIQATAELIKDMLKEMKAQAATGRTILWLTGATTVLAALAIAAPFVIEVIKGWR
ncbi:hypothetical protein [Paenarthrobacter ureafaciens]|uniref:hypothetical protein n=1 Tax=Paenarthrobacter ureafaciens TaxID=37931 RepID=UPI001FB3D806|nr:hypothetical protein [Paenarthrobacter ureafaciens]UOD80337.1 hypothetical protein MQZ73_14610 [Paenarthrobacter ureafaciens]WNZ02990.1 hypothetical protein PVT25_15250 [Paenarthrobacter ureafaciens]